MSVRIYHYSLRSNQEERSFRRWELRYTRAYVYMYIYTRKHAQNKYNDRQCRQCVYSNILRDVNFETEYMQDSSKDCCVVTFRGDKDNTSE